MVKEGVRREPTGFALCRPKLQFGGYTIPKSLSTFWGTFENKCLLLRVVSTLWGVVHPDPDDTPNTGAVVLTVVIGAWADERAEQVQSIRFVVTVRSRRPITAAATPIIRRRRIEAAGVEEVIRKAL